MEHQNNEQRSVELSPQLVSIMTTEHYNLQTGRSMTTAETNGRSTLFVGAVSSGLIALTSVGQIAHLGTAFFVFSLVVIPSLWLMGLITFERVLQAGAADLIYASGINRIRHLYLEYAPHMQPYFILSTHDDREGIVSHEAMTSSWRLQRAVAESYAMDAHREFASAPNFARELLASLVDQSFDVAGSGEIPWPSQPHPFLFDEIW